MGHMVAAVGIGQEGFAAFAHPFHRPAQGPGCKQGNQVLRVLVNLGAETTADVGRNNPEPGFGNRQ